MEARCPNCSQLADTTKLPCPRCGYSSALRKEYLYLYSIGVAWVAAGFGFGVMSVVVHEARADHWSAPLRAWFPLRAWSDAHHWIGFLIAGVIWTLAGIGLTRHRWDGFALAAATICWEIGRVTLRVCAAPTAGTVALLGLELVFAAALARVSIALRRTPPRDIDRLQRSAPLRRRRRSPILDAGRATESGPTLRATELSVLYFAQAGDLAGASRATIALGPDAALRDAISWIAEHHPPLAALLERCRFAVNQEFVDDLGHRLADGDELAILPPVSGG